MQFAHESNFSQPDYSKLVLVLCFSAVSAAYFALAIIVLHP